MPRNVFISFLGTNDYLETHYQFADGRTSSLVRFIQEAVVCDIAPDWSENDAIYIFMTKTARARNWVDDGQSGEGVRRRGLKTCLEDLGVRPKIYDIDIPEGFSESEIWDIFNIVYGHLQDFDKIHFDVTHAFRSIPLFSTILFNYARFVKSVSVVSVVYGAFEKLGPAHKVKFDTKPEDRVAPVIDLTSLVKLQQYTEIASDLVTFGRVNKDEMSQLVLDDREKPYVKELSAISDSLGRFDNALISNNLKEFKSGAFYLDYKKALHSLQEHGTEVPSPLVELFEALDGSLSGFSLKGNQWSNVDAAIRWAQDYEMLPLAYTLARESIAGRIAEHYSSMNPYNGNKAEVDFKEFVSKLCAVNQYVVKSKKYKDELAKYPDVCDKLLSKNMIKKLRNSGHYSYIASNRNTINHGQNSTYEVLCKKFDAAYKGCLAIIESEE